MEVVSPGGEVEVGGSLRVEAGCQEEEAEMGTKMMMMMMMHWAEEVLLVGQQR